MSTALAPVLPEAALGRAPVRVMVVDDAVVVRGLLARWIEADAALRLVASLRNGRQAIEQLERAEPDVVVLDVDMPDVDGITALPQLLAKRPDLVVIMASALTRHNAEVSLRALSLGAADCIPKPQSTRDIGASTAFRRELIDKVHALAARRRRSGRNTAGAPSGVPAQARASAAAAHAGRTASAPVAESRAEAKAARPSAPDPAIRLRPFPALSPRVLLLGASTGGPQALHAVIGRLNGVLDDVPVLIVQHMPPMFTTILAEHLARASGRIAREARDGEPVRAAHIYIAPGGRHMRVGRRSGIPCITLDDGPLVQFCRPAVDLLFASAAAVWGPRNLGALLTGMGCDGTRGAADVVTAGGAVIAQDESTSVMWGMPGAAAHAGLCSAVLPLAQIAPTITRLFSGARP